jgi:hypothetical protein
MGKCKLAKDKKCVLSKDVADSMMEFSTNETKVDPNKKNVVRYCMGKKRWEKHVTHFLKKPHVHPSIYFT